MILRLISEEITITPEANTTLWFQSGNTVSNARVVRVFNDSGADALVTRYSVDTTANTHTVIGSVTMANNEVQIFEKNSDERLIASANVKATSVAFSVS